MNGGVRMVGLDGGFASGLASGQAWPTDIAVGVADVFWIDQYGGTVMKVARP
jgi:hypothetical protein